MMMMTMMTMNLEMVKEFNLFFPLPAEKAVTEDNYVNERKHIFSGIFFTGQED